MNSGRECTEFITSEGINSAGYVLFYEFMYRVRGSLFLRAKNGFSVHCNRMGEPVAPQWRPSPFRNVFHCDQLTSVASVPAQWRHSESIINASGATSCILTSDLLKCAATNNNLLPECQQQKYEEITTDLFGEIGIFAVDRDDVFIFVAKNANVALDNIRIAPIYTETAHSVLFPVTNGTVLIVDSVIDNGYDIGYNPDECTTVLNERLNGDNDSISRLIIECNVFEFDNDFMTENVMTSAATSFVDHFSASMFELHPLSTSYYPGMNQMFNYTVTDRRGNVIEDGLVQNTTITLSTAFFSSLLWFDVNGDCQICEEGVWISDISLADDVGEQYTLHLSVDNNRLILAQDAITLNITGCPAGYGADSDNFTCSICEADTYNLEDGSLRECTDCDTVNNPGILCTFCSPTS